MYVDLPKQRRRRRVMRPSMLVRKNMQGGNFLDSLVKTVTKPLIDTAGAVLQTGLRSGIKGVRSGIGAGRRRRQAGGVSLSQAVKKAKEVNRLLKDKRAISTALTLMGKHGMAEKARKYGYGRRRRQAGAGLGDVLKKAQQVNKFLKEKKAVSTALDLLGKKSLADRARKAGYGRARRPKRVTQPKLINY